MIKFFRKIRQKLLSQNRFNKYLIYASGEIILVVIGILIALQINNWNEKRKINNDLNRLFIALESELERNVLEINKLMNAGHRADSVQALFIENKVTKATMRANPGLAFFDYRTRSTFLEDERLNEVIAQEKQLSSEKKNLLTNIKLIKRRIKAWRFWQNKTLELAMQRRKELASKTPVITDKNRDEVFEKLFTRSLEDKIYRNEVLHYTGMQLGENVWEANLIRTSSIILLWKLRSSKNKALKINTFLKKLDLEPLIEFPCGMVPNKEYETYFDRSILIYNSQDVPVNITLRSKNSDRIDSQKIPAKSFLDPSIYFDIDNTRYFEYRKNEKCLKLYDANKEDYIIL